MEMIVPGAVCCSMLMVKDTEAGTRATVSKYGGCFTQSVQIWGDGGGGMGVALQYADDAMQHVGCMTYRRQQAAAYS